MLHSFGQEQRENKIKHTVEKYQQEKVYIGS